MNEKLEATARSIRVAYLNDAIAPLRDVLDPTDADGAYTVQALNTAFWEQQGRQPVGRKIGLTAKAVQAQLGVDQPDFGVLFEDMRLENGANLNASRVLQPKAEAEIAIILKKDIVDPDADIDAVMDATDYVSPAIEIVDSRIADWKITFADTVADNGSSAFFVIGEERHAPDTVDLFSCGMVMQVNGETVSLGAGAACLGHPLNAAAWLARAMVSLGTPLKAGEVVLTGALGPMVALSAGDQVHATIGGIGTCQFTYEAANR